MELGEFFIGCWFSTGPNLFKCTDTGTRTVVAVRINDVEVTTHDSVTGKTERVVIDLRNTNRDWLNGPPYALAELVFDEDDMLACTAVSDPTAWRPSLDAR